MSEITKATTGLFVDDTMQVSLEASDIGWDVGCWPPAATTTLGNGQPFVASHREIRDGELLWVDYLQANGCLRLRVYND